MRRGTQGFLWHWQFFDVDSDYTDVCFIIIHHTMHLYLMHLSVCELYFTIRFLNRRYYEQLYTYILENLGKMDKFLENYYFPKWNKKEIISLSSL